MHWLLAAAAPARAAADLSETALINRYPVIAVTLTVLFFAGIAADVYLLIRWLVLRSEGVARLKVARASWGITEVLVAVAIILGSSVPLALLLAGLSLPGLLLAELTVRVGMLFALVEFFRRRATDWQEAFGLRGCSATAAIGSGALAYLAAIPPLLVTFVVYERLLRLAGVPISTQPIADLFVKTGSIPALVLLITFAVIVAPVFEEVAFRGFAYPALKARLGAGRALLVVSCFFALMHAHLPSAGPLFVLSLALGLAYELTGSILTPILVHALFNATNVATLLYVRAHS